MFTLQSIPTRGTVGTSGSTSIADLPRNLKILCVYMRGPNRPEVGDLSGAEHPAMGGDEHDIIIDTLRQRRNNALSVSRDLYASSPCPAQEIL